MLFIGCSHNDTSKINENSITNNQAIEILQCFDTKDAESLKKMFSPEIIATHDLDTEITGAMAFYDGTSVSYEIINGGSGKSIREGNITEFRMSYAIEKICTDKNKSYIISPSVYVVNETNPQYVGIMYIVIIDNSGNEFEIGEWK